ncbi:MAG: cobyrinate a,c-diamide synthase, partial [Hyphomicrobiaceae bacterium]
MAEQCTRGRGVVIAAPSSGAGKTTVTMGVIAALRRQGLSVAAAKSGPDYIDPRFLEAATGQPCQNLDSWAMQPEALRGRLAQIAETVDIVVVEGAMGLFDGAAGGGGATADLADILGLPVILVVDASRQAQSIAAVVHGFATFRPTTRVAGVIATRVGSERHGDMIAGALSQMAPEYLGHVRFDTAVGIESRHLGLVQAGEHQHIATLIEQLADSVDADVDLAKIGSLADHINKEGRIDRLQPIGQRLAIASDNAFGFTYRHQLDDWHRQGAEISFFSPLDDEAPGDDVDAVFLPGGYPELYAERLAHADRFKCGVQRA